MKRYLFVKHQKLTIREYLKKFNSCISCISNYYYYHSDNRRARDSTPTDWARCELSQTDITQTGMSTGQ